MKKRENKKQPAPAGIPLLATVIAKSTEPAIVSMPTARPSVLSNPLEHIDELNRMSPFWGAVSTRVLCSAIGFYAVNAVLWAYRKRNQEPKYNSTIDWYNEAIAKREGDETSAQNFREQGHDTLKFVDGLQHLGHYKYLFGLVASSPIETRFELPSPASIFQRMVERDEDRVAMLAEYEKFDMERIKNGPNFAYIEARMKRNKMANDARMVRKSQAEIDHIHQELASVKSEPFDDHAWSTIPLWAQFRLARSVHKQVIAAIASETEKPADERLHLEDLNALGEAVLLELEAANREPEVKLAFERNVLKVENHGLIERGPKSPTVNKLGD